MTRGTVTDCSQWFYAVLRTMQWHLIMSPWRRGLATDLPLAMPIYRRKLVDIDTGEGLRRRSWQRLPEVINYPIVSVSLVSISICGTSPSSWSSSSWEQGVQGLEAGLYGRVKASKFIFGEGMSMVSYCERVTPSWLTADSVFGLSRWNARKLSLEALNIDWRTPLLWDSRENPEPYPFSVSWSCHVDMDGTDDKTDEKEGCVHLET